MDCIHHRQEKKVSSRGKHSVDKQRMMWGESPWTHRKLLDYITRSGKNDQKNKQHFSTLFPFLHPCLKTGCDLTTLTNHAHIALQVHN